MRNKTTMGRAKVNKSKAKNAQNACCPIISIKCEMVQGKARRTFEKVSDKYAYENPGKVKVVRGSPGVWKSIAPPPKKMCTVKAGTRTVKKNVTSDEAGKKVAELKKQLVDRRCLAVVTSNAGVGIPR